MSAGQAAPDFFEESRHFLFADFLESGAARKGYVIGQFEQRRKGTIEDSPEAKRHVQRISEILGIKIQACRIISGGRAMDIVVGPSSTKLHFLDSQNTPAIDSPIEMTDTITAAGNRDFFTKALSAQEVCLAQEEINTILGVERPRPCRIIISEPPAAETGRALDTGRDAILESSPAEAAMVTSMKGTSKLSEVSVGLVTRYAEAAGSLSAEDRSRVERWMEQHPHVRKDVEDMRQNEKFYRGVSSTFSDI